MPFSRINKALGRNIQNVDSPQFRLANGSNTKLRTHGRIDNGTPSINDLLSPEQQHLS